MIQKTLLALAVLFTLSGCSVQAAENEEKKNATVKTTKSDKTMGTIHLTKAEFLEKVFDFESNPTEWKYNGEIPAIVDFYASWCGPCRTIAPILEELAKEYDGKVHIYKVDTEAEPELAAAFGIQSIPSILFIPMKGQPQMAKGALPKASFKKAIDELLLESK
ncbi:MAG: thioredoxin [Bacteroidales bacterium]